MSDFDEEAAVTEIKTWSKRVEHLTSAEASRAYFREGIHSSLADGTMPYSEALRMVSLGHEDVDVATREHVAGYIAAGSPVPEELRTYACCALFTAPVTYPPGNATVDDLNRNYAICALVQAAMERWPHLKRYRGRHAKRQKPSACSLIAQALGMGEDRVDQVVREQRKGKLAQKIAAS